MIEMLRHDFIRNALCACMLMGAACAVVGVYIVFKRIVFVGITLAQVSTAGISVALLAGLPSTLSALAFCMTTVLLLAPLTRRQRLPQEAVIGTVYVAASAVTALILALSPLDQGQVLNLLFGNVLTISPGYLLCVTLMCLGVMTAHALFHRHFFFAIFDPEGACAFGYSARLWDAMLYLMIGVVISLAIQALGTLLCFGFLVGPATAGLLIGRRLRGIFFMALASAAAGAVIGMWASYRADLPSGPSVCAVLALEVLATGVLRRIRG